MEESNLLTIKAKKRIKTGDNAAWREKLDKILEKTDSDGKKLFTRYELNCNDGNVRDCFLWTQEQEEGEQQRKIHYSVPKNEYTISEDDVKKGTDIFYRAAEKAEGLGHTELDISDIPEKFKEEAKKQIEKVNVMIDGKMQSMRVVDFSSQRLLDSFTI